MNASRPAPNVTLPEAVVVIGLVAIGPLLAWARVPAPALFMAVVLYGIFMRRVLWRHLPR